MSTKQTIWVSRVDNDCLRWIQLATTTYNSLIGKNWSCRSQLPWSCCSPDKTTRWPRHVTQTAGTIRWASEYIIGQPPALLLRRQRTVLPCRPADSRRCPLSLDTNHHIPVFRAAGHSAGKNRCCGSSRRSCCCQGSDLGLEHRLADTNLESTGNITDMIFKLQNWHGSILRFTGAARGDLHPIRAPTPTPCYVVHHLQAWRMLDQTPTQPEVK